MFEYNKKEEDFKDLVVYYLPKVKKIIEICKTLIK